MAGNSEKEDSFGAAASQDGTSGAASLATQDGKMYIAVCDGEIEYAQHLTEYLTMRCCLPYEVLTFSGPERLLESGLRRQVAVLVASESAYSPEIEAAAFPSVLVLNETDRYLGESPPSISKYQSMEQIAAYLIENCIDRDAPRAPAIRHGRAMRMIGLYTPVSRCLQTTFALTLGQVLARRARVLYMDLTCFSGLESLLGEGPGGVIGGSAGGRPGGAHRGGIGDLLYFNECAREKLSGELPRLTTDAGGVDVVSGFPSAFELGRVTAAQWLSLFSQVGRVSEYEYLVLDLSAQADGLLEILRACSLIGMIVRDDRVSAAQIAQYEQVLRSMEYQDVRARTLRIRFPVFARLPSDLHFLTHGELADHVRRLLEKEEWRDGLTGAGSGAIYPPALRDP